MARIGARVPMAQTDARLETMPMAPSGVVTLNATMLPLGSLPLGTAGHAAEVDCNRNPSCTEQRKYGGPDCQWE